MNKFRLLRADEIECRVSTSNPAKGLSLFLYKDARCDMNILDDTVGADNWMDDFYEAKGTLFCKIGIRVQRENGYEWIWKGDAGSPSNMEAIKGEASDARKRAGFAWGIGRELYTAPFIWIGKDSVKWTKDRNGKEVPASRFSVVKIGYDDKRRINELVISVDGKQTFDMTPKKNIEPEQQPVICPKCGKPILKETIKGKVRMPEEILEKMGCCLTCWNEAKNEVPNS